MVGQKICTCPGSPTSPNITTGGEYLPFSPHSIGNLKQMISLFLCNLKINLKINQTCLLQLSGTLGHLHYTWIGLSFKLLFHLNKILHFFVKLSLDELLFYTVGTVLGISVKLQFKIWLYLAQRRWQVVILSFCHVSNTSHVI